MHRPNPRSTAVCFANLKLKIAALAALQFRRVPFHKLTQNKMSVRAGSDVNRTIGETSGERAPD
jgi:hypothetical protein